jgi:hypothetical protein
MTAMTLERAKLVDMIRRLPDEYLPPVERALDRLICGMDTEEVIRLFEAETGRTVKRRGAP